MAEPEKDQIGDGQDNFGQAAGKAIQAAKQISHDAAAEAAVKGAEATANAAAAVVQAVAGSGKAVENRPPPVGKDYNDTLVQYMQEYRAHCISMDDILEETR